MKSLKKILWITLIIMTVTYIPSMALTSNEKMTIEAQNTLDNINILSQIEDSGILPIADTEKTIEFTGTWRSMIYTVKRTKGSSGITITVLNYSSKLVDVALFKKGEAVLIGSTQSIYPNQLSLLSWTNSEIEGNPDEVDIHFSMYQTASNEMTVAITY